jgi:hypothetical protein
MASSAAAQLEGATLSHGDLTRKTPVNELIRSASFGGLGKQVFHPHPKTNLSNITRSIRPLHVLGKLLAWSDALVLQQLDDRTNLSIQYFKIREEFFKDLFCGADAHFQSPG